jgi:nucleotide-binding universal stress UspA family protein
MKNLSMDELMQFESNAHLKDLVDQESARIYELLEVSVGMHSTPYVPPPDEAVVVKIGEVVVEDARRAAEQRGVAECSTIVVDGNAVDQILKQAELLNADLIVMGHRGLGAFRTLLGGSVSNKVSQLAKCTCISVK